jgi:cell division protein FtsI (penicillin-binding protein 3)
VQGYNISFGQGLEMSPIQVMRFYGLLANKGTIVQPHFLLDVPSSDEEITYSSEKVVDNDQAIDSLDTMLEAVVDEGTGTQAAIDGYRVAGKTGTAEIASSSGGYKAGVYNISFVGYLPDASTNLVCFVGATEVPGEYKTVPAFHDIMEFAIDRYHITQD